MFKNKKSLRAFIVMTVLLLALVINGIFTLGSVRNNPSKAWQSQPGSDNAGTFFSDYVVLEVTATDKDGNTVSTTDGNGNTLIYAWINTGKIQKANTKQGYGVINLRWKTNTDFSSGSLSSNKDTIEIKKGVDTSKEQFQYNWYKFQTNRFYRYCQVSTDDALEINEIVFTNKDGVVLQTKVVGANEWTELSSGAVQEKYVTTENLSKKSTALGICDEQSKFQEYSSMAKKYNFTEQESSVINAALTVFNMDGNFVDKTIGALGLELVSLGLAVFGINTLGVRIISYLFFILTVVLLFSLGRRVFKDSDYGLLCAVFYLLFGLGLSVGGFGSVNSIGVFFAVLAVYFMHMFYTETSGYYFNKKHTFSASRTSLFVPVLLSSISFALAVNVKLSMAFVLPVIIALFVIGCLKLKRIHTLNAKLAKYEDENIANDKQFKINTVGTSIVFVLSFVIFPFILMLLFYGIIGSSYTAFYKADNLVEAISMNLKGSLFAKPNNGAAIFTWLAGGGSTSVLKGDGRLSNIFIAMNPAVQIISLFCFILITAAVIGRFTAKNRSAEYKKETKSLLVPYIVLTVGYLFTWMLSAFTINTGVSEYLLSSVFAVGFIALGAKLAKLYDCKVFEICGREISLHLISLIVAIAVSALFFGLGYVMFVGIKVPEIAAKILFGWWLW